SKVVAAPSGILIRRRIASQLHRFLPAAKGAVDRLRPPWRRRNFSIVLRFPRIGSLWLINRQTTVPRKDDENNGDHDENDNYKLFRIHVFPENISGVHTLHFSEYIWILVQEIFFFPNSAVQSKGWLGNAFKYQIYL